MESNTAIRPSPPERLPSRTALRAALASSRDISVLQRYLNIVGQQPRGKENGLRVLLQISAEVGNLRYTEILLEEGADVNGFSQSSIKDKTHLPSKSSLPALYYAVQGGHLDVVRLLLSRGAKVSGTDDDLRSVIMYGAQKGNVEVLKLLLDRNPDIRGTDEQGRNVAMHAVTAGHVEALRLLLSYGANVTHRDKNQMTSLMCAASSGNVELLRILLLEKNVDLNSEDKHGRTALTHAALAGRTESLKLLIDCGASTTQRDESGKTALMHAVMNGHNEIVDILLSNGAGVDGIDDDGVSVLMHAIIGGHVPCVRILLDSGTDLQSTGENGKCLKHAALAGQNDILELLLLHKAKIDCVDKQGRSILLNLAADTSKYPKWNAATIRIVLDAGANYQKTDILNRTALDWAAVNGHTELANSILEKGDSHLGKTVSSKIVNVGAKRGKVALHLAAKHNQPEIAELLLRYGAEIEATSEGQWTPLLYAAAAGNLDVFDTLLVHRANVNASTSNGKTSLHLAAEHGYPEIVDRILKEDTALTNTKDAFDCTPLSLAAQHNHSNIIQALKPHIFKYSVSEHAFKACTSFTAAVVDFYPKADTLDINVNRKSVWDTVYAFDQENTNKFITTTRLQNVEAKKPEFRWIHLPANNLVWAEAVITKMFLEAGAEDVTGFKVMLRILSQQQHRGPKVHSRFMRPACLDVRREFGNPKPQQSLTINSTPVDYRKPHGAASRYKTSEIVTDTRISDATVLFMPYLHWETDKNRDEMRKFVLEVLADAKSRLSSLEGKDELLIRAYLRNSAELHLRRTLDQYKHHGINTDKRDRDQVVYRFCIENADKIKVPKIYMVDQLWVWVFDEIVLTCFPERRGQPRRDTLNVFDGVIKDIRAKTSAQVKSVQELAALITNRCAGTFDRHDWAYDEFLFLEMFELSIGTVTDKSTTLLETFEKESVAAAKWLRAHDKQRAKALTKIKDNDDAIEPPQEDEWVYNEDGTGEDDSGKAEPKFLNRLLSIAKEADLLVECKDIQDELEILTTVLRQQKAVLHNMSMIFKRASLLRGRKRAEVTKKCSQQDRLLDSQLLDIERMDSQVKSVGKSLTQVLDLKQKHANALEARFALDQAQGTARQGETIMVFTIVTIVFLPMSFMAAFFALNVVEFPHDSTQNQGLHISYVSKYVFGIGLGVSVPLVAIAFAFGYVREWLADASARRQTRKSSVKEYELRPSARPPTVLTVGKTKRTASEDSRLFHPSRKRTDRTDETKSTGRDLESQ